MEIFKNKVGRPSNEILKKRKIFKVSLVLIVILIIVSISIFLFNYHNSKKLRGYVARDKVELCNNTKIYLSATSKISYKGSGTYYIWDSKVSNNRIQITKKEKYVGKKIYSAGWVEINDLSSCSSKTTEYKIGDVNMDGKITSVDSRLISQHVSGIKKLTGKSLELADVNKDGNVTATDARMVLQIIAGIDPTASTTTTTVVKDAITMTKIDSKWYVDDVKTVNVTMKVSGDSYKADSSDSNVLKVSNQGTSNFKVTAVGEGKAKITVTSTKTSQSVSYEYTVTRKNDSGDFTIDVKFADSISNSNDTYKYDTSGKKNVTITLNNSTGKTRYYRWFIYHSSYNNEPYHKEICKSYNSKITHNESSALTYDETKKVILVRSYLSKSDCEADTNGKGTKFVTEKKVSYELDRIYMNGNFKMIKYNHAGLSKDVGSQASGKCNLAAAAYAAYVLTDGACVVPVNKYKISDMGGTLSSRKSIDEIWNYIVGRIDKSIPVAIRVTANQDGGRTGEHWLTVVGYNTKADIKKLTNVNIRENLYIIDPVYYYSNGVKVYSSKANKKNITLWQGIGSNRQDSFLNYRNDGAFDVASWAEIKKFVCKE